MVGTALWSKLNKGIKIVAIPSAVAPVPNIETNFKSVATQAAISGVSFNGLVSMEIAHDNPNYMVAALNSGSTENVGWYSINGGVTWTAVPFTSSFVIPSAISANGKTMVIGRANTAGRAWKSTDYGSTWIDQNLTLLSIQTITDIAVDHDGTYVFFNQSVSPSFRRILATADWLNGANYVSTSAPWNTYSLALAKTGRIYITKFNDASNRIIAYTDNFAPATVWTSVTIAAGNSPNPRIRCSSDGKHVFYVSGVTNVFYISNDFGVTWTTKTMTTNVYVFGFGVSKSGKYMVIASSVTNGLYFRSTDFGNTWSDITLAGMSTVIKSLIVAET